MIEFHRFTDFTPVDGYRVFFLDERPQAVRVVAAVYCGGRPLLFFNSEDRCPTRHVVLWQGDADDTDHGIARRIYYLADALCRFFNTGGAASELDDVVERFLTEVASGPLQLPQGYRLIDSYVNDDGHYEHVFAPPEGGRPFVWVEDAVACFPDTADDKRRVIIRPVEHAPVAALPGRSDPQKT